MQRCCHVRSEQHLRYENILSTDVSHQSGPKPANQIASGHILMSSVRLDSVYLKETLTIWIQQNSFNLRSGNGALVESSPKTGSCFILTKKKSAIKQTDLRDMFKKVFKSVCTSSVVVSSDFLYHTPSAPSAFFFKKKGGGEGKKK